MAIRKEDVKSISQELGCGPRFAFDLLTLAGGDKNLVFEASSKCSGANEMKVFIIDHRFKKIEGR